MNEYKGSMKAAGRRFALIAARFNENHVGHLVSGARDFFLRHGVAEKDVDLLWVPGSFEIPYAANMAARTGKYHAVIGLGVIIRGATTHFELVAGEAARGLAAVSRETGVPAIFGVVTAETAEQAQERCGGKMGNKGWDAAQAAMEMADLAAVFGSEGNGAVPGPTARAGVSGTAGRVE